MGKIITFYSYKGGVGRSMALANIGTLLCELGNRVLIVDFDLEAPGIEKYFEQFIMQEIPELKCRGVVDLINSIVQPVKKKWRDGILKYSIPKKNIKIDILPSGRKTSSYAKEVQSINWEKLFSEHNLGFFLENLRNEWKRDYDFILVDSRTGLSDIGGICTIYLPDIIIFLFTTNEISLNGSIDIINRAKKGRNLIPFDRNMLITLPLPSRDESRTENKLAISWHRKFKNRLENFYIDWLPKDVSTSEVIDLLRIPYIPIWSFGDRLPVIEEGTAKIDSIGYIYDKVANLINNDFDWYKIHKPRAKIKKNIKQLKGKTMNSDRYITERVNSQIDWYSKNSTRNKFSFYYLTTLQIVIGGILPLFSIIELDNFIQFKDILVSTCGISIIIITGLLNIGKYRENWLNYRKTAELLKQEKYKYLTNSFPYEEDSEYNYKLFVQKVEEVFSKENLSWENTVNKKEIKKSNFTDT